MGRRPSVVNDADKPEGRSVCLCAEITVAGLMGEGRRDLIADIGAIDVSAKPRAIGGGPVPALPLGGRVLSVNSPDDRSTIITVAAWNIGESQSISRRRANPSHAERQFIDFMERKQRSDGSFFAAIRRLAVRLDRSPCAPCANALAGLLRDICACQPGSGAVIVRRSGVTVSRTEARAAGPPATLEWTQLYENRVQGTSWADLLDLNRAGWQLIAPRDARPIDRAYQTELVRIEDA